MDIVQLRHLLAVFDAGSLSRAAARLRVSPPALSRRMPQLERELGVGLVDRGPRGARPPRAGFDFSRDAHRLVRQLDHRTASAADRHEVRGLVTHVESLGTTVRLPESGAAGTVPPLSCTVGKAPDRARCRPDPSPIRHAVVRTAAGAAAPGGALAVTRTRAEAGRRPGTRPEEGPT